MKKILLVVLVGLLLIPVLYRPFALSLDSDSVTYNVAARLHDARWSMSLDPSDAYAHPVVQLLVDFHGIWRQLVYLPLFIFVDSLGIPLNEVSLNAIFALVAVALFALVYKMLGVILDKKSAAWIVVLLATIPFFVISVKGGWWYNFVYPLFVGGLFCLHKYLRYSIEPFGHKKASHWYAAFCVTAVAYLFADTGYIFGLFFYALYVWFFYFAHYRSYKEAVVGIKNTLLRVWTLLPLVTIAGQAALVIVGQRYFQSEFGILARLLEKKGGVGLSMGPFYRAITEGPALLGWFLFIAIVAALVILIRKSTSKTAPPLIRASMWYVPIGFVLLVLSSGGAAIYYTLHIPALILLVYVMREVVSPRKGVVVLAIVVMLTWGQTVLYNSGYTPKSDSLIKPLPLEGASPLWFPWHFARPRNLGVKTAGFVLRDYLKQSPIEYVSLQENFYERSEEVFFYSSYIQGPSFALGRRITIHPDKIDKAKIIFRFTDGAASVAPLSPPIFIEENQKKVLDFLQEHPEFVHVATVTAQEQPLIEIFQKDSELEYRVFSVEEYDRLFDQQYGNLESLAHIDLG